MNAPRPAAAQAVVFDMDGLILDTEPLYRAASQTAARELGYDIDDALYERLVGRAVADVEAILHAALGEAFPMDAFRTRWHAHWERLVARGIALKPGFLPLLEALEARAVPVAVATSTHRARARASLSAAGLAARLPLVVTGEEVAAGKPAPDIYLAAADRLGVEPPLCVALEDSEAGVLAAAAAGMRTLLVPDLVPPSPAAARAAWRVLPSLHHARLLVLALLDHACA